MHVQEKKKTFHGLDLLESIKNTFAILWRYTNTVDVTCVLISVERTDGLTKCTQSQDEVGLTPLQVFSFKLTKARGKSTNRFYSHIHHNNNN